MDDYCEGTTFMVASFEGFSPEELLGDLFDPEDFDEDGEIVLKEKDAK